MTTTTHYVGDTAVLTETSDGQRFAWIVSHSIGFLEGLADHLLYMEHGEVVEEGPAEHLLNSPQDPRTKDFVAQAK